MMVLLSTKRLSAPPLRHFISTLALGQGAICPLLTQGSKRISSPGSMLVGSISFSVTDTSEVTVNAAELLISPLLASG